MSAAAGRRGPSGRELLAGLIVFLVNVVVMAVELLATRLLFPRYGNTIFTWSAVITIVIAGLFAGYWGGGVLADRRQDRFALLSAELAASAALVLLVPFLCDWLLLKGAIGADLYPPLFGAFIVFGLPAAALASVPPAGVGVVASEGRSAAAASGVVSALSALGSVAGTLATTFWLIPQFGVRALFIGFGAALFLLAALARVYAGARVKASRAAAAVLAFALAGAASVSATTHPVLTTLVEPVFRKDSQYQLVRVFEHGAGGGLTRLLMLDSTQEGAMRLSDSEVVFEYTRAYRAFVNAFGGSEALRRILYIGGGAYTMPVRTAELLPQAQVDVAEVDPVVEAAAKKYFRAGEPPNLKTILADGRQAAASRPGQYDALFVDAYQGVYAIPFHLATREFFETLRSSLKPGGFAAFNVIGSVSEREGFLCSFAVTLRQVFPRVDLYPVEGVREASQNIILVAGPKDGLLDRDLMKGAQFPVRLSEEGLACGPSTLVLTDDHAPVEWLVAKYLARER